LSKGTEEDQGKHSKNCNWVKLRNRDLRNTSKCANKSKGKVKRTGLGVGVGDWSCGSPG